MKNLLRPLLLAAAIFALGSPARATYEEQLAERTKLKTQIQNAKVRNQELQRLQLKYLEDPGAAKTTERMMTEAQKTISQLERKLQGVQNKIVKSENTRMQERMKENARLLAQKSSRDGAMNAAQEGAKNAARDLARNSSKDSSKDSGKSSGQDAAKSAVHSVPVCKPTPGH